MGRDAFGVEPGNELPGYYQAFLWNLAEWEGVVSDRCKEMRLMG